MSFAPADVWTIVAAVLALIILGLHFRWSPLPHLCMAALATILIVAAVTLSTIDAKADSGADDNTTLWLIFDVSRSMLARDVGTSRLERSKELALPLLEAPGNRRIGIAAFAGGASVICPPTFNRAFLKQSLALVSVDSAPPGGSQLTSVWELLTTDQKDVSQRWLIFTDGGHDDDFWKPDDDSLSTDRKIEIVLIGIGDPNQKHPIPEGDGFVTERGRYVETILDSKQLQRVASELRSRYLEVGAGSAELTNLWPSTSSVATSNSRRSRDLRYAYDWLLAPAVLLWMLSFVPWPLSRQRET